MSKNTAIFLLVISLGFKTSFSQQVISSTGDFFHNSAGMISQTIGEPVIETYTSLSSILTQGFQQSHLTPNNCIIQNVIIASGQNICYSAIQHIILAGGGSTFTVENGGSITLIAGQMIWMLPGTNVEPGGYLHAYITTTGAYCNTLKNELVENNETGPENYLPAIISENQFFKVYPNPTSGTFTLEFKQFDDTPGIYIEISDLRGENVLKKQLTRQESYEFSLATKPSGVYFIRVTTNGKTQTTKIIKQ